ncbi:MAG: response regulator transcription factor [Cellulosilyticaceae bacterium]
MTKKILLIEDDEAISMAISFALRKEQFEVACAGSLAEARAYFNEEVHLVLLDLNLPDGIGYQFCREALEVSKVPIIFLTVRDEEADIIRGLDMGADDYITKPFRMGVLLSRVQAVLRRSQKQASPFLECRTMRLDKEQGRVYKEDQEILLTKNEYKLLLLLMENQGCTVSRERILDYLWGVDGEFVNDNTLTVMMKRLREKIEEPTEKWIHTIRGIGYRMEA